MLSSAFICVRYTGSSPGFANGRSMSLCSKTTRPASPANVRMLSRAGFVRLAPSPATFDDTNSLWIENSPIPENTPGNTLSTRRMWSAAYMSAGLKPVIIGSKRACSAGVSDWYCIAM
jgi:hypothetical protein